MTTLVAREIVYYSSRDEDCFFSWLHQIKCVSDVRGIGCELHISLNETQISDDDLREFISLFHRYGVDKAQLSQFINQNNTIWFANENAYWYRDVFIKSP